LFFVFLYNLSFRFFPSSYPQTAYFTNMSALSETRLLHFKNI
jgi:hypothetical protein